MLCLYGGGGWLCVYIELNESRIETYRTIVYYRIIGGRSEIVQQVKLQVVIEIYMEKILSMYVVLGQT